MGKFQVPIGMKRPSLEREIYKFTAEDGREFEIELGPLTPSGIDSAEQLADEIERRYVTGNCMYKGDRRKDPVPFHTPDGKPLEVPAYKTILTAARIEFMQGIRRPDLDCEVGEDQYSAEDLIIISFWYPDLWYTLRAKAIEVLAGFGSQGKETPGPLEPQSPQVSGSE